MAYIETSPSSRRSPKVDFTAMVDLFDELHITAVPHYVMQSPTHEELAIVP